MPTFSHPLKPCLVLGTGFHQWVLGESMRQDFKALHSWPTLLLQVAKALGVALDSRQDHLSLLWEQLLTTAVHDGLKPDGQPTLAPNAHPPLAAHQVERLAKQAAAEVLQPLQGSYPVNSQQAQFPLDAAWGAVVSLNFDAHWWQASPSVSSGNSATRLHWGHPNGGLANPLPPTTPVTGHAGIPGEELLRLNNHVVLQTNPTKRLWFPNGYLGRPRSLRLGLREFGFQPVAIHQAFNAVKAFERQAGRFEIRQPWVHAVLDGNTPQQPLPDGAPIHLPLTWVTEMLYRPVCFAGVGLSESEAGLWWLMAQRARNLANVPLAQRPRACILLDAKDPRLPFWHTHPCGIEPIVCSDWNDGWAQVQAWAWAWAWAWG